MDGRTILKRQSRLAVFPHDESLSIVSASFLDHSCHGLSFFCALLVKVMTVASKSMLKDSFFICLELPKF